MLKILVATVPSFREKKYSIEALHFTIKFIILSDMHAQQWLYSRFVNTQGRPGCNIPADEYQEHLEYVKIQFPT